MVVVILRLKFALFGESVKESPWAIFPLIAFTVFGVYAATHSLSELLAGPDPAALPSAVLVRGSAVLVLFSLAPILIPPSTFHLRIGDLQRFKLSPRSITTAYLLSSLAHPLALVTTVTAVVFVLRTPSLDLPERLAGIGCVWVGAALFRVIGQSIVGCRRLYGTLIVAAFATIGLAMVVVTSGIIPALVRWVPLAGIVLGLSPFGSAWAAVMPTTTTGAQLLCAAIWDVVLGVLAIRIVKAASYGSVLPAASSRTSPWPRPIASGSSPVAALAVRQIVYAVRDQRRQRENLAALFLVLVIVGFALLAGSLISAIQVAMIGVVTVIAVSPHNSLALDRTALWPNIVASVRGIHDRLGRSLPAFLAGATTIIIGGALVFIVSNDLEAALLAAVASFCVLCAGIGLSSVTSIALAYPPRHDETNLPAPSQPFREAVAWGGVVALALISSTPSLVVMADHGSDWWTLPVNCVACVAVLAIGLRVGASLYDRNIQAWFTQAAAGRYTLELLRRAHAGDR